MASDTDSSPDVAHPDVTNPDVNPDVQGEPESPHSQSAAHPAIRSAAQSALPAAYESLAPIHSPASTSTVKLRRRPRWRRSELLRRARPGLRSQATLTLALGALLISVAVATLTYVVARRSLVAERRSVIERLSFANAIDVQSTLTRNGSNLAALLRRQNQDDLSSIVFADRVFTSSASVSARNIPSELRRVVRAKPATGETAKTFAYQIVRQGGHTELIVGVPLDAANAEYYGIASLSAVEGRLRSLARTLALAALLSSAGAAFVGRSVIRRVLRPLTAVAAGAAGISSGRLDTRLALTGDIDLDPLLVSFNEMAQTLQGRIEREARFASDVSHELRTPLTALVTAARLLDGRRDELSERSQKTLDVLVMQTAHFERLVLDLLEISRFDAGAAELHAEVVHLPELIRMVVKVNGFDAAVDWQDLNPPEMGVDKRRVDRMVANLLQNAANYGGGAVAIRLSNGPSEADSMPDSVDDPVGSRHVLISVDDAGPGIPEQERTAIFERFRRGQTHQRAANAPKGTGLGLALVRAHANLHGGDVWVEDRPGGGARFVIDLVEADVAE